MPFGNDSEQPDELFLLKEKIIELEAYKSHTEKIEAELASSENYYRTIFDTTGTATLILEEDMIISLANTELERLAGYSREEIEGKKSILDFISDEDVERIQEYHRLRRKKLFVPNKYEMTLRNREGESRSISLSVNIIPGTEKSVVSLLDISEQKQAQSALRKAYDDLDGRVKERTSEISRINELLKKENKEREMAANKYRESEKILRSFVNAINESAFLMDTNGTILLINEITAKRLGYKVEEILGKRIYDFFSGDIARLRKDKATEVILSGQPVHFEDCRNGVYLLNSIYPVYDTHGRISSLATFSYDITERKRIEEERIRAAVERAMIIDAMGDGLLLLDMNG